MFIALINCFWWLCGFVLSRAAVRLKFLIAINLLIKNLILVNLTINRKVKTRQSTVYFTEKSLPNTRMQSQMLALRLLSLQAQPVI